MSWVEYDPVTGIKKITSYDEMTGQLVMTRQQDIEPILNRAKAIANDSAADKGIKNGFWHYCTIPETVQIELMKKGLDVFSKDPSMTKRIFKEINQNYPYLKLTQKRHE